MASKHSVLSSTETLQTVNGCFSMPRSLVQSLVEVIDACVEGIPYVPLDEANMQARGLGSMVAFWERMRHICPKVNIYHGPIFGKDGAQCVTSHDLDEAMLATRNFWFQSPVEHDEEWQPILDRYAEGEPWKPFSPPDEEMFLNTLLHTKDSAPGPDGLPYSAWRLLHKVTVEAMKSCFLDIINGTALPPHQVGVWIPKAKIGPEAVHQQAAAANSVQWWVVTRGKRCTHSTPGGLLQCKSTSSRCTLDDTQVGVQRILPLDYSTMHLVWQSACPAALFC